MESVLGTEKGICYWCDLHGYTHLHHIIHAGVSKKTQEEMGLVCYLCPSCNRNLHDHIPDEAGKDRDYEIKIFAQIAWERKYIIKHPYTLNPEEAAREEWLKQIGRNYL